jgi:serine protease Do
MYVAGDDRVRVSGVIVSADGYVITCGHHHRLPGQKLKVTLTDGRETTGTILGTNRLADVSVVKLEHGENWPFVPLGYSSAANPGDDCVVIGFPNNRKGLAPWTHNAKVEQPKHTLPARDEWEKEFWISGSPNDLGGASGGGVFDSHGELIGILLGGVFDQMQVNRVELFHREWNDLTAGTPIEAANTEWLKNVKSICDQVK